MRLNFHIYMVMLGFACFTQPLRAEITLAELLDCPPPQTRIYKTVGDRELRLAMFKPAEGNDALPKPAIVWIHGGAWLGGELYCFMPHARYFATRGLVSFVVEYRVASPYGLAVTDCLADCKSAIRYIRSHAAELGVDPNRIVVAGESAGGHLAAALGTITAFDDPADDAAINARPNVMVLFNPIVDMTDGNWIRYAVGGRALADMNSPLPNSSNDVAKARSLSPLFHISSNTPPTLLLHGLADGCVKPEQARKFEAAMKVAGRPCRLELLPDTDHGFVVALWQSPESQVVNAVHSVDKYLVSIGYLNGSSTLVLSKVPAWIPKPR